MIGLIFSLPLVGVAPCSPENFSVEDKAGQYDTDSNNILEETVECVEFWVGK